VALRGPEGDTGRTMSQENVEIVRAALQASADGDAGVIFQVASPECRVYPRPAEPDAAQEYRGLDGLMDYLTNWYGQWDEYEFELVQMLDAGEHVLVVLRERGRVERTGVEVEEEFSHSFVLRGGEIVEWHMYDSHAEALEAVGLRE
jgi:ketosteroid isomerase-like protein